MLNSIRYKEIEMPRVWKHFLKNLAWPVGLAAYIFVVIVGAEHADTLFENGAVAVVVLFVVLPIAVYLVRDMWRDAKQKVKWENEDLLRDIRGE
jgi:hypothetical protein